MSFVRKLAYYAWSILELLFGFKPLGRILGLFLSKARPGLTQFTLRASGASISVRSKMDAWSVKESFIDRFYSPAGFEVQKDWQVVDIGAAIGEFSILAGLAAVEGRVYAFEPNPESCKILAANVSVNDLESVDIHQLGVWNRAGRLALDLSGGEPLQAKSLTPAADTLEQSTIEVVTLDQVVNDIVQQPVDLLKLDCEGAEYPILFSTSADSLAKICRIVMEYHVLGEGHDRLSLTAFLEGQGFAVRHKANPVHAHLGYLYALR